MSCNGITKRSFLAAGLLSGLSGCGRRLSYNLRLRIFLTVDGRSIVGESVSKIDASEAVVALTPESGGWHQQIHGEGIFLDIGNRQNLVVTLRSVDNVPFDSWSMGKQANMRPRTGFLQESDGPIVLRRDRYPYLISFADPSNKASVTIVNPEEASEFFGRSVLVERIDLSAVKQRRTNNLKKALPWVTSQTGRNQMLSGRPPYAGKTAADQFSTFDLWRA